MLLISRDYFFAFGGTKTYSRVVKFALSKCSLVIFVLHKVNIIPWYIYKQLGSIRTKQASHILQYITHLHQHTWSIHNSYMSQMCIQNIANIFAGFLIHACWILREIREN